MGHKARPSRSTFAAFISAQPAERQDDLRALDALIRREAPALDPAEHAGMMGYGRFHYRYASGREGDAVKIGVAINKNGLSLHLLAANSKGYVAEQFASRLPKANVGKSCVRFRSLSDLDLEAVAELVRATASSGWGA